jgi:uncharacterized membrane protein YbaN (DUF454 family)
MLFLQRLLAWLAVALATIGSFLMLGKLWRLIPGPIRMIIRNTTGIILIIIGLIGWILPILPGYPFLIPGLLLLDFRQKRVFLRRVQHFWLVQKFLQNSMFAHLWRHVRRSAKNSEIPNRTELEHATQPRDRA